jgi:hypothetical protein
MLNRLKGLDPKLKQAFYLAVMGVFGVALLIVLRSCGPAETTSTFDPAPVTVPVLTEDERSASAVTFTEAVLNMGHTVTSDSYESRLQELSRGVDVSYPLVGGRYADCLLSECVWALDGAEVSTNPDGSFLVKGVAVEVNSSGTIKSPYEAFVDVDEYGKVTGFRAASVDES